MRSVVALTQLLNLRALSQSRLMIQRGNRGRIHVRGVARFIVLMKLAN
jgi:hypothetical protein